MSASRLPLSTSLSEFQRQLDRAIAAPDVSTDAFVSMEVDGDHWLIDLAHLRETSVPPPLSRMGRSPPWVIGIGSFRGQVFTVIDMRQVLLGQRTASPQQGWAMPLHDRWPGSLALLWPEMVGLVGKPELELLPPDKPLPRWARARWEDAQGKEWWEFDVAQFINSEFAGADPKVSK